jgi:hypothetical protein
MTDTVCAYLLGSEDSYHFSILLFVVRRSGHSEEISRVDFPLLHRSEVTLPVSTKEFKSMLGSVSRENAITFFHG